MTSLSVDVFFCPCAYLCRIWEENWSRGLRGLQEEESLAQRLEEEELLKRSKDYVGQDDTNWDVEAVVDEDDLFK
jgi:hypothetical protein